ncbi:MAG: TonB-dependent receptor plug domain-containing protein [Vicinamibacterales bacterium]
MFTQLHASRRWIRAVAFTGLIAAASPLPVSAQQPDLASLSLSDLMQIEIAPVFGASQRIQPVTEAPASVTIITSDEIARFGYRTLAEILRSARGFYVTYDRNYSYVGVRGFGQAGDYNTRILLLVDGHRMNDNIFDQAGIGPEFGLDPTAFDRVEIIRGPASSLYGTNAFFAVVNVITKSGALLSGANASAEVASFGTGVLKGSFGQRLASGVDVALFGTVGMSDGPSRLYYPEFDAPETADGIAANLDDEQFQQVFGRISFGQFSVRAGYASRDKGIPTAAFDTVFGDPRLRTVDRRTFVDAQYDHSFGPTRVNVRSYVDGYWYAGDYPYFSEEDADETLIEHDYGDGVWWGVDGRVSRAFSRHTVTAGGELRHNVKQDQGVGYVGMPLSLDVRESSHVVAAYVQNETRLTRWLLVNAGVRYDKYNGFDRLAPRVGVIVATSPNQAFKYLYGNAFRAPNAYESDYYAADNPLPLRPETVDTHELVWERYASTWLRTSVAGWTYDVRRLISLVFTEEDVLAYVNRGRARARGLEVEAEVRLESQVLAVFSHVLQRAEDPGSGELLVNSPRYVTQARVSMPGPHGAIASLEIQRIGARRTLSGAEVEAATVAGITARLPLGRSFTLNGNVRNMFDGIYADPASEEHVQDVIRQDGRTFRLGLEWRLGR